jgi:hypothetical protein
MWREGRVCIGLADRCIYGLLSCVRHHDMALAASTPGRHIPVHGPFAGAYANASWCTFDSASIG